MPKEKKAFTVQELKEAIIAGAQDKKAQNLLGLNLTDVSTASADFYVVCHGQSDRQAGSIAKSIEETVFNKFGIWPYHTEGYDNREWILLDYFDIVAHIFVEKQREFFAIEDLWADALIEEYEIIKTI